MAGYKEDAVEGHSLRDVLAEIGSGKPVPSCFLLYGEEEFQVQDALNRIVSALLPDAGSRDFNLFVVEGEHEDVASLCDSLLTPPLLSGRKVLVVKNTRLFESHNNLPHLITRIRERLESDPGKAAGDFMQFMSLAGLHLDDLRDDGWRNIDEEAWEKTVPGDNAAERASWLPRIIEIVIARKTPPVAKKSDDTEWLERVLSGGMPTDNHLILTAPLADRRKKLFKIISSVGKVLVFEKMKKEARQQQTVMELAAVILAKSKKRVSAGGWEALGRKTGFSLRESLGAIEKLIAYSGDNPMIEAADVEAVVGRSKEDDVFALTEALSSRNLNRSLVALHGLLDRGEAPLMIFSMMVREIRLLLQARLLIDSGQLKSLNANMSDYFRFQKVIHPAMKQLNADDQLDIVLQHPFVVYQALKHTGSFKKNELVAYLQMFAETDIQLKSTNISHPLLLERLIISVCKPTVKVS